MDISREPRIYIDKEGRISVTLADSEEEKDVLCDFCSRKNPPYKDYDCADFCHPDAPTLWSRGKWAACITCAKLVDENDLDGLAERCALMLAYEMGGWDYQAMRRFHEEFFRNRIMPQSQSVPPEPKSGQPESP
jgi:hypothetical protein